MTSHKERTSGPRVHAPFPANALGSTTGTNDVRLGGAANRGNDDADRAVRARGEKEMKWG